MSYLFLGSTVPGICLPPGTGLHVRKKHGTRVLCMSIKCKKTWRACTRYWYRTVHYCAHQIQYLMYHVGLSCGTHRPLRLPHAHMLQSSKLLVCFLFSFFAVGGLASAALVPHDRLTVISVLHFAFFFLRQWLLPHMLIVVSVFLLFSPSLHLMFCSLLSLILASFAFICLYFCCLSSWQALPHEPCQRPGGPPRHVDCCFLLSVYTG